MIGQPLQLDVVDGFEEFVFDDASLDRVMDAPLGPWAGWWSGMRGEVVCVPPSSSRHATVPSPNSPGVMVLRDEVREHIERVLGPFGEFLPVDSNVGQLWVFHCTNVVDALDLDRCEGVVWKKLPEGVSPIILFYDHLVFVPERVREGKVFVVPQRPRGLIYFAPEVAEALMDPPELFTGCTFRQPYGSNG